MAAELAAWRRHLHQYPELGFAERRTSAWLAQQLRALGLKVKTRIARTGLVAELRGGKGAGALVAIRADMDALPLQEASRRPYASKHAGRMHACGHDGNMAMALGAAKLLTQRRGELTGSVRFIFQPCEERLPGGARAMVEAGVLEHPAVAAILAAHVDSTLPPGRMSTRPGVMMAAADEVRITVLGKGGHGALPHLAVDAVHLAGQVIVALQGVISRMRNPTDPQVLTLGTIFGGSAFNVIAGRVEMLGTLRTLSAGSRRQLFRQVARAAAKTAQAFGGDAKIEFVIGHAPVYNHPRVTAIVLQSARELQGSTGVEIMPDPLLTGEDFSFYTQRVPGCFFRVGVMDKRLGPRPWHHPDFDFDEKGLVYGSAVLAQSAESIMAQGVRHSGLNRSP
jgi:amidohydrolase